MPDRSRQDLSDRDRIAGRYTGAVGGPDDRVYRQLAPVFWECLGDVAGLRVLDLGCSHGWLSGKLSAAGADVTGIDGSAVLLGKARVAHLQVTFIEHDLSTGLPDLGTTFDRILAHMVLMDVPVLEPLISYISRVLKPDGKFVFTLPHPVSSTRKCAMISSRDNPSGLSRAITAKRSGVSKVSAATITITAA